MTINSLILYFTIAASIMGSFSVFRATQLYFDNPKRTNWVFIFLTVICPIGTIAMGTYSDAWMSGVLLVSGLIHIVGACFMAERFRFYRSETPMWIGLVQLIYGVLLSIAALNVTWNPA